MSSATMSQSLTVDPQSHKDTNELPVIIVGNGPIGIYAARELLRRKPAGQLIIYGKEPWQPYNRIHLSSLLAGEKDLSGLIFELPVDDSMSVEQRYGYSVTRINTASHTITDNSGKTQAYRKLILATGSNPHIPNIPGHTLKGVFTFRGLSDAQSLIARRTRSRKTLVIGGGLLGLEAARGMQKANTEVTIIDHADRLLSRQLDETGSRRLKDYIKCQGIEIVLNAAVKKISGENTVDGVELYSGRKIACDTLIIATGIVPNIELAQQAGLETGRGIKVNDAMQTSTSDIYAIGECAEHRNEIYGLVAPGLEQAAVAIHNLCEGDSLYTGSIAAAQLKVLGKNVFSVGPMATKPSPRSGKIFNHASATNYRSILVKNFRLQGALAIGSWPEQNRILNAVARQQLIMPWQLFLFRHTGRLWQKDETQSVSQWPAATTVCQCTGVNRGQITTVINNGACSVAEVTQITGASSVCGSCRPLVQELLGANTPRNPVRWSRPLSASAALTTIMALLFFLPLVIPYTNSVQTPLQWDLLWRDGLLKQISGFTVLGLFIAGLLVTPRKRLQKLRDWGRFDNWRLLHVISGLLVLLALLAHTGFRLGYGLNLWLMLTFAGLLLAGGILTASIALEHQLDAAMALRLRRISLWLHILLFWPVPVLLGFHVFKSYYF